MFSSPYLNQHSTDNCFYFQAEDGKRGLVRSRGLGEVYRRQLKARTPPEQARPPVELAAFHSSLTKLAWPARHALPQFAYQVCFLASRTAKALDEHVRKLHAEFAAAIARAGDGRAHIAFRPVEP